MRTRLFCTLAFSIAALVAGNSRAEEEAAGDDTMTASDWVTAFQCEPLDSLYYVPSNFPEGLKRLIAMGPAASEAIEQGLADNDPCVRFTCVVALNHMRFREEEKGKVCAWLVKAARDESAWVRTESVWGLGKLGCRDAVQDLVCALGDDDPNVRREALIALDKVHWPGVLLPDMSGGGFGSLLSDERVEELLAEWRRYYVSGRQEDAGDREPPRILPKGASMHLISPPSGDEPAVVEVTLQEPPRCSIIIRIESADEIIAGVEEEGPAETVSPAEDDSKDVGTSLAPRTADGE